MAHSDENRLIRRIRDGDGAAFKELVQRHETRVASTVYHMLGRCPEAEDVGQETFIRFYQSLNTFRGDSSVATYLTRIAMNLSLNELKRRRRRNRIFPHSLDSGVDLAQEGDAFENQETRELLQRALSSLESEFRAVLVLRLVDGYSTRETAEILGIPEGTVLSRLARAQKKLLHVVRRMNGTLQQHKIME